MNAEDSNKTTLSVTLIVKNESKNIDKCLTQLEKFADEIIIYDTGSNDGTQDICKRHDKVILIQGYWDNDFARARNESLKLASCDYVMWVDADEIIDNTDWINDFIINKLSNYDSVFIETELIDNNDKVTFHFYRQRIIRRNLNPSWEGVIHETLGAEGVKSTYYVENTNFSIRNYQSVHESTRNLKIFKDLESRGKLDNARYWYYYARECGWYESDDCALEKYLKALSYDNIWNIDKLNACLAISDIYTRKKNTTKALEYAYIAAAQTQIPRADVCCKLGDIYTKLKKHSIAITWYELAVGQKSDGLNCTFMTDNYTTTYPVNMLCLAYYNIGNIEKAISYNNLLLAIDPGNSSGLYNKKFFKDK